MSARCRLFHRTTLGAVLNHSAGLIEPLALRWRVCPPEERALLLESARNQPANAYSELAGGLVVEAIIEHCTGAPADEWATENILRPAGLVDDFVIKGTVAASDRTRSRAARSVWGRKRLPLLSERLPVQLRECRLAFGAVATARGIAGVFELWRRALRGEPSACSPETVRQLVVCRRGLADDPVIQRTADFAAGVAVDLSKHQLGRGGARAVGHTAGVCIAAGIAEPDADVVIALYINGSMLDDRPRACEVRESLINAVFEDLR